MTLVLDLDFRHKSVISRSNIWFQVAKIVLYNVKKLRVVFTAQDHKPGVGGSSPPFATNKYSLYKFRNNFY